MDNSGKKSLWFLSPNAGKEDEAIEVHAALARHLISPRWKVEIYQTTGKEDVTATCWMD